jgi:hypothetical protein
MEMVVNLTWDGCDVPRLDDEQCSQRSHHTNEKARDGCTHGGV